MPRLRPSWITISAMLLPRAELSQQHGYVHAGALTSVLDTACGYAALTVAPAECDVLTVEFKINFVRPAVADRFVAIGHVTKAGKSLTVCQGEVIGGTFDVTLGSGRVHLPWLGKVPLDMAGGEVKASYTGAERRLVIEPSTLRWRVTAMPCLGSSSMQPTTTAAPYW